MKTNRTLILLAALAAMLHTACTSTAQPPPYSFEIQQRDAAGAAWLDRQIIPQPGSALVFSASRTPETLLLSQLATGAQLATLSGSVATLGDALASTGGTVAALSGSLTLHTAQIAALSGTLSNYYEWIDNVDTRLTAAASDIEWLVPDVRALSGTLALHTGSLAALDTRLAATGGTVAMLSGSLAGKQDALAAGPGITIASGTISAGFPVTNGPGGNASIKNTYGDVMDIEADGINLYGNGITILGSGILLDSEAPIRLGDRTGDTNPQKLTNLRAGTGSLDAVNKSQLDAKQDQLTAGENITLTGGTISATAGGSGGAGFPLLGAGVSLANSETGVMALSATIEYYNSKLELGYGLRFTSVDNSQGFRGTLDVGPATGYMSMYQGLVGLQDGYTTIVGGNGVHIGTGNGWESGLLFETSGARATLSGYDPSSNYVTGTIAYLSDITGGGGGAAGFPITGNAVVLENPWEGGLELTASNSYGAPADKATLHMDMSNLYGQTADGGAFGIGGDYAHLVHPNGVWIGSGAGMGDYQGLKLQSSGTRFIIEDTGTIAYLSDIPGSAGGGFPLNGNHASLTNTGAGSLGILAGDSDEDVRGTIIIGTGGNNANGGDTNRITLSAEDGEVKIRNDGGEIKIRNDGGVSIGGENVSIGGNNNVTLQGNYMELNTNGDAINLGAATAVYLSGPELVHIKAVRGNVLIDAGSADEYMTGEVVIRPTGYDNDTGEYSRGGLIIRDAGDNNSVRLKGLAAAPSSADEAASKAYVDITAGGGLPGIATDADDGNDGPRIYADGKDLVLMTRQGSGDDYPNVSIRLSEHDIIFIYVSADGSQQVTLTGILAFMANMEERLSDAGF